LSKYAVKEEIISQHKVYMSLITLKTLQSKIEIVY